MADEKNVYLEAQKVWDERFASHAQQARWWRAMAFVMAGLSTVSIGFGIWSGARTQFIPHIVAIDDLGRMQVAPRVVTIGSIPEPVLKRQLADFVSDWRAIPLDREVLRENMVRALAYVPENSPANRKLAEYGQGELTNPFRRIEKETVRVEIISVTTGGGSTWIVQWAETVRASDTGRVLREQTYQGSFVTDQLTRVNGDMLLANPLGLMVKDFDIQLISQ